MEILVVRIVLSVLVILAVVYASWDAYKKKEDKRVEDLIERKAYHWMQEFFVVEPIEIDLSTKTCYVWRGVSKTDKDICHAALYNRFGLPFEYKLTRERSMYDVIIRVEKPKYKQWRWF